MASLSTPNPVVEASEEVKPEVRIRYPTRAPFMRYMEKLVAPRASGEKALLEKRPAPAYMLEPWPKGNTFTMIKNERIKELRRQADERRKSELERCRIPGNVAHKVPRQYRQPFTAHNNLKELIYEENLKEVHAHGRLFGPPELTYQPRRKHNVPLLEQTRIDADISKDTKDAPGEKRGVSSGDSGTSKGTDSYSWDSSQKESVYDESLLPQSAHDELPNRISMLRPATAATGGAAPGSTSSGPGLHPLEAYDKNFDQVNTFIDDRRKICMVNLAIRTKEGEIARLNKMLEDEAAFLANEEKELIIRHDEHDKYLKAICLRTAEAIKKADSETRKRVQITDKIKRTRYKLAHMNAECINLEEEFLRLSTYKDFLDSVAKTLVETKAADQRVAMKFVKVDKNSSAEVAEPVPPPAPEEGASESAINAFFRSPQDLVDILAELESNNLTLIENVQEQEEACERLRLKAARLQKVLDVERTTVDDHIAREEDIIAKLMKEISEIENSREQIKEFTLLERYDVFSLGSIDQFDPPWLRESRTRRALDEEAEKPTVGQLLDILHEQIHKLYCRIFGTDGSTRLDTLMMLKILESATDDLARSLAKYSRMQVLKAKKTVDEHNRLLARQRQKEVEALAHEAKLRRAIAKSKEPPRWHMGRRIIDRSQPPKEKRKAGVEVRQETVVDEDADADLFV
ncbi:hypothetical protein ECG_09149 [Echinococcus granulosus]|uniref:Coiled coil domain containing protein 37 n=1 Tax=Echinococcus granulosus TaxID=6210 RepID=A0A068WM90_ECHGR|nr:hypothetical protein ECG_09149 [Echinococcus granulosus]CDS21251.1 coiled coil domain containing protein 37 [Echinococcus granulosus]